MDSISRQGDGIDLSSALASGAPARNWLVVFWVVTPVVLTGSLAEATLWHLQNQTVAAALSGKGVSAWLLISWLTAGDFVRIGLSAASVLPFPVLEWRSGAVSHFLRTASRTQVFIVLTSIVGWLGQAYLFPGVLLGGDSGSHIARFLEVRRGLQSGFLPQWTNYDYLGSSLLGFTGPLLYVLGGAIDVVVRDPVTTAKIILFTAHLASGWLFYALLRRFDLPRPAAMVGAFAFTGAFAHLSLFIYQGAFPQALTMLFLVLLFYEAEGVMRRPPARRLDLILFALATAGLIMNHQPHAIFAALYLALFGVASVVLGRWHLSEARCLLGAGIAGVAISTVAVLPIVAEADWVMIEPDGALFRFRLPSPQRLSHLLIWNNRVTPGGTDYWAYLGATVAVLALIGGWTGLCAHLGDERRRVALAALPCLAMCFVVYNPVVRDVMFLLFFVGIFAALGMERIAAVHKLGGRLPAIAFLLVLLDLGSTAIQPVSRNDKQFMIEAGAYLEQVAPQQRIAEIGVAQDGSFKIDIGPDSSTLSYYSTVQRVAGHHDMAATRVHNYAVTILKMAERNLRAHGSLGNASKTLLAMLNVGLIVCANPTAMGCPARFADGSADGRLGRVVRLREATPVLFSRRLVALTPPPGIEKPMFADGAYETSAQNPRVAKTVAYLKTFLNAAKISMADRMAAALPVRAVPVRSIAAAEAAGDDVATGWHARLRRYAVSLSSISMTIEADGPGFVQLAHPFFPALSITSNGRHVQPMEGAVDLIVLPLATGRNAIEIRPGTTPIRVASAGVSGAALILGLMAALLRVRRPAIDAKIHDLGRDR